MGVDETVVKVKVKGKKTVLVLVTDVESGELLGVGEQKQRRLFWSGLNGM